jgi:hypothetical protein
MKGKSYALGMLAAYRFGDGMTRRLIARAIVVMNTSPPGPYRDRWKRRLYAVCYGATWKGIATSRMEFKGSKSR